MTKRLVHVEIDCTKTTCGRCRFRDREGMVTCSLRHGYAQLLSRNKKGQWLRTEYCRFVADPRHGQA